MIKLSKQNSNLISISILIHGLIKLYFKVLKDEEWVKNNVMMKKDQYGNEMNEEQKLTIAKVNENMVIIHSSAENKFTEELYCVYYADDKINVKTFIEMEFEEIFDPRYSSSKYRL